ncbi:hypothetical protein SAMN04488118_105131 [Epibacterium ulvae]|uniref:Uncharacterized protein n=1 Tax=Epibacterium ulvae TaxID=1156985 RepID=A0A1G5QQM1_9RHOB|nr:hypothetical protein [Epibacterium ulvae]SCZ63830.1 hypothetical protein SAMN04488118_105131 [Epibacterium ulvae]
MVAIEEIVDSETFKAWLEEQPEEHRHDIAVVLATRCALRVFPVWGAALHQDWARERDFTALPVFRALLISGVSYKIPTSDTRTAAYAAYVYDAAGADAHAAAAYVAAGAAAAAGASYDAAASASYDAAASAYYDAVASTSTSAASAGVNIWATLRTDIAAMEQGYDLMQWRLWQDYIPGPMVRSWRAASDWFTRTPGHEFIRHWYNALVAGRPLTGDWDSHWKMLEEIALIDPEDWDKGETSAGAVELAAIIAEIEEKYKTLPKPQGNLAEDALALTQRNEQVSVNPKTGKLHVEARDPLPQVLYDRMQRKLNRALRKFDRVEGNGAYFLLYQDTQDWHLDINQTGNLPTDLYEICGEIVAHVKRRDRNGEIPDAKNRYVNCRVRGDRSIRRGRDLQRRFRNAGVCRTRSISDAKYRTGRRDCCAPQNGSVCG